MAVDMDEHVDTLGIETPAYLAIAKKVDTLVEHYRDDLHKHDRNFFAAHPDWPVIHCAGDCGTHIVDMRPASEYPAKNTSVPFLFGHADREHLLCSGHSALVSLEKSGSRPVVHYWTGRTLRLIDYSKARMLYVSYMQRIRHEWKS